MINGIKKETIVSTTEDRLTLLNWLKKLEKTLSDDTLTDIAFNDDGGKVSLVLTFEDGTTKSVAFPYDMSEFAKKGEGGEGSEVKLYLHQIIDNGDGYPYIAISIIKDSFVGKNFEDIAQRSNYFRCTGSQYGEGEIFELGGIFYIANRLSSGGAELYQVASFTTLASEDTVTEL